MIFVSAEWESGIGTAAGAAIGRALARPMEEARRRRLAQESSGHLDEGEKLVAPVAIGTRGARVPVFVALGILVVTMIAMIFIGDRIGNLADVVYFGALGAAWLLTVVGSIVAHKYAVALTDRRLLVFRRGPVSGRHIVELFIAAPRGDVSTGFKTWRLGPWGILSLEFAPAAGQAPIQLDLWGVDTPIAGAIHQALATPAASGPGSSKLPAGQ